MLQTSFAILLTLVIAIGGGAASVWYALNSLGGLGAVTVSGWTAYPLAGTPQADPYSKARNAREGSLPLGRAEGVAFAAERDAEGNLLSRNCSYSVQGVVPPARFWTLYATDARQRALAGSDGQPPAISSYAAVRKADNSIAVAVGPSPAPGNWLRVAGSGEMRLVLTLYDTPSAASESIAESRLPQVVKTGCDG